MHRHLPLAAFLLGLAAVAWVGAGYLPDHPLALALVLTIAGVYLTGAAELRRFRQATTALAQAVAATTGPPPALGPWLDALPAGLRSAVRLRVHGERVALPGPALTPYLTGLLVLLGMLGTFLGMVVTLRGTGLALENATDVEAIRASLAAPVKGLGLAFGTSVAGVAASAMLGLMSALLRRERQQAVRALDEAIAGPLRVLTPGHQREQHREDLLRLQRQQADSLGQALPALLAQMQALTEGMDRRGQATHDALLASQQRFQDEAQRAYTGLAASVDRSLQHSLAESARLVGAAIEPAVQATMAQLGRETASLRDTLGQAVQQQIEAVGERLDRSADTLLRGVEQQATTLLRGVEQQSTTLLRGVEQQSTALLHGVEGQSTALLRSVAESHAAADAAGLARDRERTAALQASLQAMTETLLRQGLQDAQALAERQQQICSTLERSAQAITAQAEAHARATIGEITRLVQTASEAPRAAAQVIGELRAALSDSLVRDNAVLDERNRLMATLAGLLDAVNHASTEQRSAIDALVRSATEVLDRVGARFAQTVGAEAQTLQAVAAQVTGSAAEVASLGEGFGLAMQLFSGASESLLAQLQRIESALSQSMARSDEQLAYYVAQAREIVDLTLGSQKQIVDDLQRLARHPVEAAAE